MENNTKIENSKQPYDELMNKVINKLNRVILNKILQYLYRAYGKPSNIEYIWNGTNEYVFDWLVTHFNAVCKCPIAVQKTQADDDWSSHIYELNVNKVLKYFKL